MNIKDVIPEVVNGTVTALVWAVLLWIANRARNYLAERRLRRALSSVAVHQGHDTFGIIVKNDSAYDITVREVVLKTNSPTEAYYLLFAESGYDYMFQEKPFKDPRSITLHQLSSPRQRQPLTERSANLGPFTQGLWIAPVQLFLDHPNLAPTQCHLAIQYNSLLGNPKVLVIDSNERCSASLKESFDKFIKSRTMQSSVPVTRDTPPARAGAAPESPVR